MYVDGSMIPHFKFNQYYFIIIIVLFFSRLTDESN